MSADELELARLRRELAEMTGCATHWCAEAGRSEREHRETLVRCRTAAQILIEAIGAVGPENVEETARRAVEALAARTRAHHTEQSSHHATLTEFYEVRTARDEARRELDLERGQKKADLLQELAELTVALRDLIDSVTAAKCRDTIVLRDLEAARALLGKGRS